MKRNYVISFALAAFCFGMTTNSFAQKQGVNLVENGSFEQLDDLDGSPIGWTLANNSSESKIMSSNILTTDSKDGQNCLELEAYKGIVDVPSSSFAANGDELISDASQMDKAKPFVVSCWYKNVKGQNNLSVALRVHWNEENKADGDKTEDINYQVATFKIIKDTTTTWTYGEASGRFFNINYRLNTNAKIYSEPWLNVLVTVMGSPRNYVKMLVDDIKVFYNQTSGIDETVIRPLPVKAEGTTLYVAANAGEQIRLYTTNGSQVATAAAVQGTTRIDNLPKGLLLVKAGKQTAKVLMK